MDQDNNPIEIANVRIQGQITGTVTDLRGHYSLTVPSKDSVVLVYSMLGYNTKKRVLKNPKGEITLNVILLNSGYELGEVTVTESKRQTGMTERIKAKDRKLMPDSEMPGLPGQKDQGIRCPSLWHHDRIRQPVQP
jgi:hypothetical protein